MGKTASGRIVLKKGFLIHLRDSPLAQASPFDDVDLKRHAYLNSILASNGDAIGVKGRGKAEKKGKGKAKPGMKEKEKEKKQKPDHGTKADSATTTTTTHAQSRVVPPPGFGAPSHPSQAKGHSNVQVQSRPHQSQEPVRSLIEETIPGMPKLRVNANPRSVDVKDGRNVNINTNTDAQRFNSTSAASSVSSSRRKRRDLWDDPGTAMFSWEKKPVPQSQASQEAGQGHSGPDGFGGSGSGDALQSFLRMMRKNDGVEREGDEIDAIDRGEIVESEESSRHRVIPVHVEEQEKENVREKEEEEEVPIDLMAELGLKSTGKEGNGEIVDWLKPFLSEEGDGGVTKQNIKAETGLDVGLDEDDEDVILFAGSSNNASTSNANGNRNRVVEREPTNTASASSSSRFERLFQSQNSQRGARGDGSVQNVRIPNVQTESVKRSLNMNMNLDYTENSRENSNGNVSVSDDSRKASSGTGVHISLDSLFQSVSNADASAVKMLYDRKSKLEGRGVAGARKTSTEEEGEGGEGDKRKDMVVSGEERMTSIPTTHPIPKPKAPIAFPMSHIHTPPPRSTQSRTRISSASAQRKVAPPSVVSVRQTQNETQAQNASVSVKQNVNLFGVGASVGGQGGGGEGSLARFFGGEAGLFKVSGAAPLPEMPTTSIRLPKQ